MSFEPGDSLGDQGEDIARSYLEEQSFQILEQNLETPVGECDLLARDGEHLVLVEVKTRRTTGFGPPEEAVHYEKQRQLQKIARYLLTQYEDPTIRFDVVAIEQHGPDSSIRHHEGAFDGSR